jgi:hypothetical protein
MNCNNKASTKVGQGSCAERLPHLLKAVNGASSIGVISSRTTRLPVQQLQCNKPTSPLPHLLKAVKAASSTGVNSSRTTRLPIMQKRHAGHVYPHLPKAVKAASS